MLDELDHARGQVARVTKRLRELARAERHRSAVARPADGARGSGRSRR